MTRTRAYLDHAATSPLRPEARAAMLEAMEIGGNASSVHAEGRAARGVIEKARAEVSALVKAPAARVVFTSGGTEANNLALDSLLADPTGTGRDRLLVSATEHDSVRKGGRFPAAKVKTIPVTQDGVVDLDALGAMLESGGRPLVSVMLANNETGVIQPIRRIAEIVHAAGGLLHVDAVQAAGKIEIDFAELGADMLTLSGHKLGGPQGAGALVLREGVEPTPLMTGGGQERARRSGTEPLIAIAGFGAAAKAARETLDSEAGRLGALRKRLESGLMAISPASRIAGTSVERLPGIVSLVTPGLAAETAVIGFDLAGVAISSGSACSSGKVKASHVLAAMGFSGADASSGLRFSLGWSSGQDDVDAALATFQSIMVPASRSPR